MNLKERFEAFDDDTLFDRVRDYTDAEVYPELAELQRRMFEGHVALVAEQHGYSLHRFIDLLRSRTEEN